jgi:uncharacterized protein YndB with AHSA1/START domain
MVQLPTDAMRTSDGADIAFHGEYREIVPGERIVHTEVFEGMPDTQALTTVTFAGSGGRTTLTILVRHDSQRDDDAHARYMQDGLQEALDQLEQAVTSLRSGS